METLERALTGEQLADKFMQASIAHKAGFFNHLQSKPEIEKDMAKVWASSALTWDGQHFLTTTIREPIGSY